MKITDPMRRCLFLLDCHGAALRVWYGSRGHEWSWHIDGVAMSRSVDRCFRAGLVTAESRDRLVLSPLGRRVLQRA